MSRLWIVPVLAGAAALLGGCQQQEFDCENTLWIYTAKQGDTYWSISEKTYGYGVFWVYIANANQHMLNAPLRKGQELVVPCVERSPEGRPIPPKACKPRRIPPGPR